MSKISSRTNRRSARNKPKRIYGAQKGTGKKTITNLVDVCIPFFGEWGLLAKAIRCINAARDSMRDPLRVIVLDNGTPPWTREDGTLVPNEEQEANVRPLLREADIWGRMKQNAGYPGGINAAVRKGVAPLILLSSADVFLQPDAISQLVRAMDDPMVGVAAPMLLFPEDDSPNGPPGKVQSVGMAFDIEGIPFHVYLGWSRDHAKVRGVKDVQAVTGACFMTRRQIWQRLGGMPEVYGVGTYEDMDFCFQVRSLGLKIIVQPLAWGFHQVGGSIRDGANKGGFPLPMTSTIFRGRWGGSLAWDAWRFF